MAYRADTTIGAMIRLTLARVLAALAGTEVFELDDLDAARARFDTLGKGSG